MRRLLALMSRSLQKAGRVQGEGPGDEWINLGRKITCSIPLNGLRWS
jgi:hypothetical protein